MLVTTRLIILHIDFQNSTKKCLLIDGQPPSKEVLPSHQPIQCAPEIMREYLEIQPEWVTFVLVDVEVEEDDVLYVYYTCMIPNIVEQRMGEWVEIGRVEDGNIQKLVFEAASKLLSRF